MSPVIDDCHICGSDDAELISPKGYQHLQCNHYLCIDCWRGTARLKPICPMCREDIKVWMEYMEFDICTQSVYDTSTYNISDDVSYVIQLPRLSYNADFDGEEDLLIYRGYSVSLEQYAYNMPMRYDDISHIIGGDPVMARNMIISQEDRVTDDNGRFGPHGSINTLPPKEDIPDEEYD
tara:strand:+ start:540 stop:1076 length:537 start_codon:yes stop_codon:yes gene_type:complete